MLQKDLNSKRQFKTFYIYEELGTIINCFVAQLKYNTTEYFEILIHNTNLAQALQILVQTDFFMNLLKGAFQTRFKVIPIHFIKGIRLMSKQLMLLNKRLTSE